jgi:hypothetical protein
MPHEISTIRVSEHYAMRPDAGGEFLNTVHDGTELSQVEAPSPGRSLPDTQFLPDRHLEIKQGVAVCQKLLTDPFPVSFTKRSFLILNRGDCR